MSIASPTEDKRCFLVCDQRVLYLIYKPVVYFDVSLYRDIYLIRISYSRKMTIIIIIIFM